MGVGGKAKELEQTQGGWIKVTLVSWQIGGGFWFCSVFICWLYNCLCVFQFLIMERPKKKNDLKRISDSFIFKRLLALLNVFVLVSVFFTGYPI